MIQNPLNEILKVQNDITTLQSNVSQIQSTINSLPTSYVRIINPTLMASYSLQDLVNISNTNEYMLGYIYWNDSKSPDGNSVFVLVGGYTVIAISFTGSIYTCNEESVVWTLKNSG